MLDATLAVAVAVEEAAPVAVALQLSSPEGFDTGFTASQVAVSSVVAAVSHALDSAVGTDESMFSLVLPLMCATEDPRPPLDPPRPRPLPSKPARPPREALPVLPVSPGVVAVSLTLDRERSFLTFETSPHCVIEPAKRVSKRLYTYVLEGVFCPSVPAQNVVAQKHTVSYAIYRGLQIAVSFLQSEDNIFICPIREHLLNCRNFTAVFFLQLADFSGLLNRWSRNI
jgi:hypothetical protein